jgi:hypothetical protein
MNHDRRLRIGQEPPDGVTVDKIVFLRARYEDVLGATLVQPLDDEASQEAGSACHHDTARFPVDHVHLSVDIARAP